MGGWLLFSFGILCLILIPFAPELMRLRIRFFRWVHWTWAVSVLERHFRRWVLFFRIVLLLIAALLLSVGWAETR